MIIGELLQINEMVEPQTNVAPFTYQAFPGSHTIASYWINEFGAADESISLQLTIIAFIETYSNYYVVVDDLLSCIETEGSLFWDFETNKLYVHYIHDSSRFAGYYEYGNVVGFTNKRSVYIGNIWYEALISSFPSLSQQQDIINYDKLAFINGSIDHRNNGGKLDYLKDQYIIGTEYKVYVLDDSDYRENYERSELVDLASLYIEDYTYKLGTLTLDVQDMRKRQNIMIPTDVFTVDDYPDINEKYIGNIIPLLYGPIRYSEAIPVDGDAGVGNDTNFRQAVVLTSLGTVQVEIDGLWTTKVPTATDLSTGSFTLAEVDSRKANGTPYKCRVIGSIGIANTYASDIIIDLNNRYLGLPYNVGLYNTTEWETEETSLESIGILFNKQVELFEAVRMIQEGSNIGFRYEIIAGKRTIRIDDNDRASSAYYSNVENADIESMAISTQSELLSAKVKVNYALDYIENKYLSYEDDSYEDQVNQRYRQQPQQEIFTHLITEVQAIARAELYSERFSDIPHIVDLSLMGIDKYTLRIFDIITLELCLCTVDAATAQTLSREFFGVWNCKVLGIDPQYDQIQNKITAQLIKKINPVYKVRITKTGVLRSTKTSGTAIIKRGVA